MKHNKIPCDKEADWLDSHSEERLKYRGEYIAVAGEEIVAHGIDFIGVIEKAKKVSDDPLIAKIPKEELMIV
ncbi:MAG: DUF5678 domain-containing protein [bacterium]